MFVIFFHFCLQGNVIAIKRVNRQRVELNRNVLMEIKHVSIFNTREHKQTQIQTYKQARTNTRVE